MVTDTRLSLRDDGIAAALARPGAEGTALPGTVVLLLSLVLAAAGAAAGLHLETAAALAAGVMAGTAVGRRVDRRWTWLTPPLLRAIEYLAVLWAGLVVQDAGPATYAALSALAFRHYDLVYRGRTFGEAALDGPLRWLLGGWQARTAIVVAAALTGAVTPVLWVLAVVVAVLALADTAVTWRQGPAARVGAIDVADEEEL
jgi:hypothetical protein